MHPHSFDNILTFINETMIITLEIKSMAVTYVSIKKYVKFEINAHLTPHPICVITCGNGVVLKSPVGVRVSVPTDQVPCKTIEISNLHCALYTHYVT